jgi:hypothetical protein
MHEPPPEPPPFTSMPAIRRVLTEDWSSPKPVSLRRIASEPSQLGWKRSFGVVQIHTRPLMEHERGATPMRRISTSLRLTLLGDADAHEEEEYRASNTPPRPKRLSLVINRRACITKVTVELGFLLRVFVVLALLSNVSGMVAAVGPRPGAQYGATTRTVASRHATAAPWHSYLRAQPVAPSATFAPAALDGPIAAWRQMAPLRAHTGLVRLCLAAEHAMTSRPIRLSKKGRHLERVMASHFSEALCMLAFPKSYGRMQRWHELRAPRAIDELKEAKARLEAALDERLPAGSYRIEARVKTARSLFEKTVLRGKRVHDLCGLRVIVDTGVEAERRASWVASSQVTSSPGGRCAEVALRVGDVVLDGLPLAQSRPAKDYVLQPKPNGYQSLHLHLTLPSGAPLEVQVRTRCMHEAAVLGSASHGRYKANELGIGAWLRDL